MPQESAEPSFLPAPWTSLPDHPRIKAVRSGFLSYKDTDIHSSLPEDFVCATGTQTTYLISLYHSQKRYALWPAYSQLLPTEMENLFQMPLTVYQTLFLYFFLFSVLPHSVWRYPAVLLHPPVSEDSLLHPCGVLPVHIQNHHTHLLRSFWKIWSFHLIFS